ncbi:putative ketoamine kinase slr1563 [Gammaproteobacteria bacterium]
MWQRVAKSIEAALGRPFAPRQVGLIGGGCINQAVCLGDGDQQVFVKFNQSQHLGMFEAEAAGLTALAGAGGLRVPTPFCTGVVDGQAFLAMEFLSLGSPNRDSAARGGRGLAALHRHTGPNFGWERDNTIGSTPQRNAWSASWQDFWGEQRLGFQLDLAARHGQGGRLQRQGERLMERFPALLDPHTVPSLLHGDLWGGNLGHVAGEPVIFDPAVYYGDREADLAMTELFGGFDPAFYAAYREAWPLAPGYPQRRLLYNLYHVLNHLNLFAGGYLRQAESMMDRLLAELG